MNAEDIKRQRKKLNFTQKKLAELLGVSVQTVNGYENGKEIPSTKIQLLQKILYLEESNILNNPEVHYESLTGYDKKIEEINDLIKAREEIITLSKNQNDIDHQKEMIRLLRTTINLIDEAKKNHGKDL